MTLSRVTSGGRPRLAPGDITATSIPAGSHGTILLPADIADPVTGLISVSFAPFATVSLYAVRV